jgi:glycosyltransferase involved in cell wall biosynthesis
MEISVIISTYNPEPFAISETLNSLKTQTLQQGKWELIIIDNNSTNDVPANLDLRWHSNSKLVREKRQGLTYCRIKGFNMAIGRIIIMIDDDNVVANDYLEVVLQHFDSNELLGTIGGKVEGEFLHGTPPKWTVPFWNMLALRDFGPQPIVSAPTIAGGYPNCAPVGAGMAIKRALLKNYISSIEDNDTFVTDRVGDSLSSGGDNEINISILQQGYSVGYFPDLKLKHLIPSSRLTISYLSKLNYESSKSWVQLLLKYQLSPWQTISQWSAWLRKIKAWISFKVLLSSANHVKWKGACGIFDGLIRRK